MTEVRRIERRMGIRQVERLSDYLHYLYQSSAEVNVLYRELLIGVTRFFRDPDTFDGGEESRRVVEGVYRAVIWWPRPK